jgi:two-component system, OmpR family, sensor histidine kinase VicK
LDHLSELINDLLDVSRIEAGRLELRRQTFDLDRLVTDVAHALQVTTSQHVIDVSLSTTPVRIEGDAERIEQVISNLITNAIKYSPEGGAIKIRCGRWGQTITPPPSAPAAIALDEGEWAVVSVEDHGIGIAPDHLVHIFDRFYRAMGDQHFGGLGLGLYISRELVEHHGGYIWAASQPGRGTRIAFALPLIPVPETTEAGRPPAPLTLPAPHETPAQP